MRSLFPTRSAIGFWSAAVTGLALGGLCLWSRLTFGEVWFEQLAYHLRFGATGLLQTDTTTLLQFGTMVVALPVLLATALLWCPAGARRAVGRVLLFAGLLAFLVNFRFGSYLASFFGPDVFMAHEVRADRSTIRPVGKPRSLLIIYVESLESGYHDAGRFGRDLLPGLGAAAGRHASVARLHQADGAHWTIAGIVASQCGVPLKVSLLPPPEDRRFGLRSFLPGARCLSDILRERGYENVFMNGPDLAFADLGTFLRDHGYARRLGAAEWAQRGEDREQLRRWGLRDDRLLVHARAELERLMAGGGLFNLSVLTVDTHGPRGILSPTCQSQGARDFAGILACTDRQLSEWLAEIEQRGWLDRLAVVVIGDHIAMENPLHDRLQRGPRHIYNLIASQPRATLTTADALQFDFYPTLLALAGWQAEGGRLGLGHCLLESCGIAAPDAARIELFRGDLLNRSPRYDALWQPLATQQ